MEGFDLDPIRQCRNLRALVNVLRNHGPAAARGIRMNSPLSDTTFAVLDVETTGLHPSSDRIVEVAVERFRMGSAHVDSYCTLVNPQRDIGDESIHGISAAEAAQAPTFGQIVGDVLERLSGAVIVGHNVRFDLTFLKRELARCGVELPDVPWLCTCRLSQHLLADALSHQLTVACEACGVVAGGWHTASGDAAATRALLAALLDAAARRGFDGIDTLLQRFGSGPEMRTANLRGLVPPSGIAVSRAEAEKAVAEGDLHYLKRLATSLRPVADLPASDEPLRLYLHLLDRVLEDRRIDDSEVDQLLELAAEWGLTLADARRAHRIYGEMLVATAMEDGVVTDAERSDLELVARLLGLGDGWLEESLREAASEALVMPAPRPSGDQALAGCCVCFTGQFIGPDGGGITRPAATARAEAVGLTVVPNLTKRVHVLIVADRNTQSGKAKKAQAYGTRVMAESVFWAQLARLNSG